ncbi:ribosomal protein L29 [Eubacterium saphenum ATCC 49989]|nr:ribosomal protein L29 [Eubacterium saphenum ATCC 49989]
MELKEMRDLDKEQLLGKLETSKQDLFNLRFQHVTGQLENPIAMREKRKEIARIKTVINEKENDK